MFNLFTPPKILKAPPPLPPEFLFWTHDEAVNVACEIEKIAPKYGFHVALTGGTLYKSGPRKDADFLFYKIRQHPRMNIRGLKRGLMDIGFQPASVHGWVHKMTYHGKGVDLLFPEVKQKAGWY